MSTVQTWQTVSTSSDNTLELAAQIGAKLRGGEVIELTSDLGGGKTTFVRGLVQGLGSDDVVHSPSFTVSNQYKAGKLQFYHFDFYRLTDPGIMEQELEEVLTEQDAVVAIEWADIVESALPADHIKLSIKVTGETEREFNFSYPTQFAYLFEDNT